MPTMMYEYYDRVPERYSSVGSGAGVGYILPTRTGYIGLNALTSAQWRMLCAFLDRADIAEDPKFRGVTWPNPDARVEEIREAPQFSLNPGIWCSMQASGHFQRASRRAVNASFQEMAGPKSSAPE